LLIVGRYIFQQPSNHHHTLFERLLDDGGSGMDFSDMDRATGAW
jgi:hypothetical protein